MSEESSIRDKPAWTRKPWLIYIVAMALWIACWTAGRYFDRDYGHGLPDCFGYAIRSASIEGAGPLLIVTGLVTAAIRDGLSSDNAMAFGVAMPVSGVCIYVMLAAGMTRIGRRWHPLAHLGVALAWLFVGAQFLTMGMGK